MVKYQASEIGVFSIETENLNAFLIACYKHMTIGTSLTFCKVICDNRLYHFSIDRGKQALHIYFINTVNMIKYTQLRAPFTYADMAILPQPADDLSDIFDLNGKSILVNDFFVSIKIRLGQMPLEKFTAVCLINSTWLKEQAPITKKPSPPLPWWKRIIIWPWT